MKKRLLMGTVLSLGMMTASAQVTPTEQMEQLGRGVVVVAGQNGGRFISWRLLGTDDWKNTTFDVLRNGELIAGDLLGTTSFTDAAGTTNDTYQVVTRVSGQVTDTSDQLQSWDDFYTSIQLDRPSDEYTPNDMSVGDVDGDGEYELFVKWDPSNSKDNASSGTTSSCIIDCYRLDGTKLWRVDLGKNIRSGAHYTQFMVYDFDADGKAEMICKTAPGSKDGKGNYVSAAADDNAIIGTNNSTSYVNSSGKPLSGPEYLTVFNGETGAAVHTIWYNPNRAGNYGKADNHPSKDFWGDDSGNRCDRYLAGVAHLDKGARTASGIFCRGYYTRAYVWAVDYTGGKLKHRWLHASTSSSAYSVTDANFNVTNKSGLKPTSGQGSGTMYKNGNHNLSIADVDGDGKDEIIWGSAACDDNGYLLYGVGFGHGDAMHLADLLPDRPGLEVFDVHEDEGTYAWDIHDARTGEVLFKGGPEGVDNGRGLAAQVSADHRESFFSSAADNQTRSCLTGEVVSEYGPLINNYRIFWDGDLQEELLGDISRHNQPILEKWNGNGYTRMYPKRNTNLYGIGNSMTINGTKGVPCLQADILGDWREEMVFYDGSDPSRINIFSTNVPSNYRVPTLMHDHIYRMGIAWQNTSYNQPPHLGFYLPDYADDYVADEQQQGVDELQVVFSQDYEQETDGSSWTSQNAQGGLMIGSDSEHGQFLQYAPGAISGARMAYTLFPQELYTYRLEFDAWIHWGNDGATEVTVMSESGTIGRNNNYYLDNNGQSNFLFNMKSTGGRSTVYNVNTTDQQISIPDQAWCHYTIDVDGDARVATFKVRDTSAGMTLGSGSYDLPEGVSPMVKGLYVVLGRSYGELRFDNIIVSADPSATAIQTVGQQENSPAQLFNLQGQRLSQPQRGLNIRQGRKFFSR